MAQTNVAEQLCKKRAGSKTIFADAPPSGRGAMMQDHLESPTYPSRFLFYVLVLIHQCECYIFFVNVDWVGTDDDQTGKGTHPAFLSRKVPEMLGIRLLLGSTEDFLCG